MTDAAPVDKLCYAPSREIPHPAHPWTDIDTTADRPTLVIRHCDGWAAVTPMWLNALRTSPGAPANHHAERAER